MVKNALGSRTDMAWKHGICIDGDPRKIQCKFCQKTITGGVYRLKHHLAGTQKEVVACKSVTDEVKGEMFEVVVGLQQKLMKKIRLDTNDDVIEIEKRKRIEEEDRTIFKKGQPVHRP